MTPAQRGARDVKRGKARAAKVLAAKKQPAPKPRSASQEQFLEDMAMNDVIIRDIRNVFEQVQKLGDWVGDLDRRTRTTGVASDQIDPPGAMHTSQAIGGGTRPMTGQANGLKRLAEARPSSPVFDALDEIQCQGNLLHETISRLEDKLTMVISPRPANPVDGVGADRAGGSTIMGVLHDRILMVRGARLRIETLIEALEV